VIVLVAVALLTAGCGAWHDEREATFGFDFPPSAADESPSAIVFFVDGVSRNVFERMLSDGRLPMIHKYFVDRGLYARRCVSSVPSVTLACETSFVTGVFPGRHGVTGIKWFDRNRLIRRNYETIAQKNTLAGDYIAPTVYERLEGETTMSLFFQAHRGATKFAENWTSAGPPYFFGWYDLVDRLSLLRFHIAASVARQREAFPALTVAYMLWPDMEAYRSGVSTEAYERSLVHTDAQIGRVLRDLEAAGRLDTTVIVLTTDHGMVDVDRHWPIEKAFRDDFRLDVATGHRWEETTFEDRLDHYRRFACVLAGSGDRYWAVSLRKPKPDGGAGEDGGGPALENWLVRPSADDLRAYPTRDGDRIDLIKRLRAQEAVDLVAWRAGPERIHVTNRRGTAEITRSLFGEGRSAMPRQLWHGVLLDEVYAYRVVQGEDPLGYADALPPKMVLGQPHTAADWLEATIDTTYPDLVPQLAAYFDAPRSGDLAVFAAPGWDFGEVHKAGHGGLAPGEMLTPLLMAGPGVPHERREAPMRAVDVAATLLDLLGKPVPEDIDGRSIVGEE
jgi:arylsulfatase A-like enzyme